MTDESSALLRRQFLRGIGSASLLALSGCVVGSDRTTDINFEDFRTVGGSKHSEDSDRPDLDQPVPEELAECTSIEGHQRNPDELVPKDQVAYQQHPANYQLCANCVFFCPSTTTSPLGACTRVEGLIGSQHWCGLWEPARGLDRNPNPTSHDRDE